MTKLYINNSYEFIDCPEMFLSLIREYMGDDLEKLQDNYDEICNQLTDLQISLDEANERIDDLQNYIDDINSNEC